MKKGIAHLGERENNRTSGSESSHDESSWRLNNLMGGAATIELSNLLQNITKAPTRTRQKFERVTYLAWPHWRNNKDAGVQTQSSGEHFICIYEVSTVGTPVKWVQTHPQ